MQIRIFINRRKITKSTEIFLDFQISHKYIKRLIKQFH